MLLFPFIKQVNNKIFVNEKSAGEKGSSFAEMNRSSSSNAKQGPTKQYNAFKDFHDSETTAHILVAWMKFSGMNGLEGLSNFICLPDNYSDCIIQIVKTVSVVNVLFQKICILPPPGGFLFFFWFESLTLLEIPV